VISFLIAITLMAALQVPRVPHRFGKAMRASRTITKWPGCSHSVDTIIAGTFMLGSALAAGAGILYAIKDKSISAADGVMVGLKAFVAAVIGGIGICRRGRRRVAPRLCEEFIVVTRLELA